MNETGESSFQQPYILLIRLRGERSYLSLRTVLHSVLNNIDNAQDRRVTTVRAQCASREGNAAQSRELRSLNFSDPRAGRLAPFQIKP